MVVMRPARFAFAFRPELRFRQKRLGNFMLAMASAFTASTVLPNAVVSLMIEKEGWMLPPDLSALQWPEWKSVLAKMTESKCVARMLATAISLILNPRFLTVCASFRETSFDGWTTAHNFTVARPTQSMSPGRKSTPRL
jgi:hypothetical protein